MASESSHYELEEQVTHTEYVGEKRKSGHIPTAEFELKDGLPISLKSGEQSFAVETTVVKEGAREFFSHIVEKSREGDPLAVTFANPQAKEYFECLTRAYYSKVVSQMQKGLQAELELEHSSGPGKYQGTIQASLDKLQIHRVTKEVKQGRAPGPVSELGALAGDLTEALQERFDEFQFRYLGDALPLQPKKQPEPLVVRFPENDPLGNYAAEVLEWLEETQAKDIPVAIQTTKIGFQRPLTITKLSLGEVVATVHQQFFVEERVAEKALFANQVLHFRPRKQVTIFETNYFDELETSSEQTNITSRPKKIAGTSGKVFSGGKMLLNLSADKVIDNIHEIDDGKYQAQERLEIYAPRAARIADHESGHIFNDFNYAATKAQSEGFANSLEDGFEFKTALKKLRVSSGYEKDVSKERLQLILGNNSPEGLNQDEVYEVPSTFFCWLYEKTGPDDFMRFYGLLTGGAFESRGDGLKKLERDLTLRDSKKYYQGNVIACLSALPRDEHFPWKDADELLDEYLKDVNPKPAE